jgi:hypothetical protein
MTKFEKIENGKYRYRGYIISKKRVYSGRGFSYWWTITVNHYKNDLHESRQHAADRIDMLIEDGIA